jgi:acetyl esterase/lipase
VNRIAFAVAVIVSCGSPLFACVSSADKPDPQLRLLWPGGAPGAIGDDEKDKPSITVYLPPAETANGLAVVVCPGGGYGALALDHEGKQIADWLNSNGITAFVLRYRIAPRYHHPAPLEDAQRAIRTVRAHAAEWKIDSNRIGILGFSAGGHLTSSAGTHFDKGNPDAQDPIDRVSCRPDFMVLVYPVISFSEPFTHLGSKRNLLGESPDDKLVANYSNEKQVTSETPPTFLVHTSEDSAVPPENSVAFYLALRKAGVAAEMHIYERGRHGLGLGANDPAFATWPSHCITWLRGRGMLSREASKN